MMQNVNSKRMKIFKMLGRKRLDLPLNRVVECIGTVLLKCHQFKSNVTGVVFTKYFFDYNVTRFLLSNCTEEK